VLYSWHFLGNCFLTFLSNMLTDLFRHKARWSSALGARDILDPGDGPRPLRPGVHFFL